MYFNNYNRAGQPREVVDGAGTVELSYDFASRLLSSAYASGPLAGITVSNHFNPYFGRDTVGVLGLSAPLVDSYSYDPNSGRLASVSSGNCTAAYGYVPNSDLLQTTTFNNNGNTVLTTTRTWDYGFRLHSIANVVNNAPVTSHSYQYDASNRRTQATLEDGSFWQYGYDDRDELTSATRNWSYFNTVTPVSGQQFSYAYDNIGNRQTASFGGNTSGVNLRTISYGANSLDQYTNITTPGFENILGAALATNSVTVNGGMADRHGEYFHQELSVANTNQPVWQTVTNITGTFTNKGGLVFPASSQTLVYDPDGNLTFDGVWNYQWDGENQLISMNMTNIAGLTVNAQGMVTNRLRLDFAYDSMGRRIQKIVSIWNASAPSFQPATTNIFVYDNRRLLTVLNPQASILQSFMWGHDLSGTTSGAGGVGGLLMESIFGTNTFAAYDGNGNITALISATDKTLAARYEYSPFHELLRATGPFAHLNAFRSSTKFWDDESGLVYYNYRFYSPSLGKWLARDPSGEPGSLNLFQFVLNNPCSTVDPDGDAPTKLLNWLGIIMTCGQIAVGAPPPDWAKVMASEARQEAKIREAIEIDDPDDMGEGGGGGKGKGFKPLTGLTLSLIGLGLAAVTAETAAAESAIGHYAGVQYGSVYCEDMYTDVDRQATGYDDLDAALATLEVVGFEAGPAVVAYGVFSEAEEAYSY